MPLTLAPTLLSTLRMDQVGSWLRPAALKEAYARFEEGALSASQLREAQDQAVRQIVEQQELHGLPVVTDGEYRRLNFQDSFGASIAGFATQADTIHFHLNRASGGAPGQRWDPGYTGAGPAIVHRRPVVERLSLSQNLPLMEYQFARSVATRPVKVTLVGPDRVSQRFDYEDPRSREVYADVDAFVDDVVAVERQIIGELAAAGCQYVQLDEPGYTAYVDEPSLAEMRARGEDPQANLSRSLAAEAALMADFPGMTFGMHLCRGNQASMWHREGSYDAIAEQLFSSLPCQRLLLEYDTERAGSFAPLRFVRPGMVVVLGLVSTKTPRLETEEELVRRIDEASAYLPLEQLALSPQCGFSSDVHGNLLSEDDQWRKIDVIHRVVQRVWGTTGPQAA